MKTSLRIDGNVVAHDDVLESFGRRTFPQLCAKARITPWNKPLHTLRKSCIDDWCKAAPLNVTMEWAAHSALATTLKYYSKVSVPAPREYLELLVQSPEKLRAATGNGRGRRAATVG